jgi:ATP-dependent helicase/nuclease subunit B
MGSFLEKVINEIDFNSINFGSTCFILPNKRSSKVFKNLILENLSKPVFAPVIESIDSLVRRISGLEEIEMGQLEHQLYVNFTRHHSLKEHKELYNSNVGITFIKDSSEIEQNLQKVNKVFNDLIEINKIKSWGEKEVKNRNYQQFLIKLNASYSSFKALLLSQGKGTKGICYSEAVNNLEYFKQANSDVTYIFIGLNALSKSEELIVKELIEHNKSFIYWDIDSEFFNTKNHSASHFIKKYRNEWRFFSKNKFKWTSESFNTQKTINIVEADGFLAQAKEMGKALSTIDITKKKTAIVLGNDKLLQAFLSFIPKNIPKEALNISVPIGETAVKQTIKTLLELKINDVNQISIKYVNKILSSTLVKKVFKIEKSKITKQLYNSKKYKSIVKEQKILFRLLYEKWDTSNGIINNLIKFLKKIADCKFISDIEGQEANLILEKIKQIEGLNLENKMSKNRIKDLILLFISEVKIKVKPQRNQSINVSELLETRALDYDTVIISSVNEGVMPSGRGYSSLLPNDLKLKYGLLGFGEKDKIFSYHFYRLIQRAKEVFLIYNSNKDGLNKGEKSRFIYQLEINKNKAHQIKYHSSFSDFTTNETNKEFLKSSEAQNRIKEISLKGFSPSSLETYIKNPAKYYTQKILKIDQEESSDEYASHKTIGLIFHESLETLYQPFIGKHLNVEKLRKTQKNIETVLKNAFKTNLEDHEEGKNKIIYQVIKSSLENFIKDEINQLQQGSEIKLIALEQEIKTSLSLKNNKKVYIRGIIDRIDQKNGVTRVIDYKSGLVNSSQLVINSMNTICKDHNRSKAMQLMCYAWMYSRNHELQSLSPGIVSLRKLNKGFMKIKIKNSLNGFVGESEINLFEDELKELISEIMNPNINFVDSGL